ncbi:hypothetical protein C8Q70DRAFT_1044937 [Cubamyces menziesii]|nr:hypothetical protein C8Q70DRAFT_1044937 [Cubamyces menziesii]
MDIPLPEYTITSYGVRTQLPLIPAKVLLPRKDNGNSDLAWSLLCECESSFQHVYLALLRCQDEAGRVLALPLCLPTHFFKKGMEHVFLVGTRIDACTTCPRPYRLWSLSPTKLLHARDHIFVAELRIRRSPLRAFTIPEPHFTPKRMKITDVVLNPRCITALTAQGYRLMQPQRSENPFYRIHAFTFLRPTEAKGTERLVIRIVQAMQQDVDEVEFRVSHQTCALECEEVMGRSSPLLPKAFVDMPCVNRRPGGYAIPIPGGMACEVVAAHTESRRPPTSGATRGLAVQKDE